MNVYSQIENQRGESWDMSAYREGGKVLTAVLRRNKGCIRVKSCVVVALKLKQ